MIAPFVGLYISTLAHLTQHVFGLGVKELAIPENFRVPVDSGVQSRVSRRLVLE